MAGAEVFGRPLKDHRIADHLIFTSGLVSILSPHVVCFCHIYKRLKDGFIIIDVP
jgi:hypothetical protein